ncbi:MAG: EthD family reductase [Anaerolineales bacterium]|nr:EthD family reductase [Anaerolineales bacterium]
MYKLVILVEPQEDAAHFDSHWPLFLAEAEKMPGLRREVTSRVDRVLHGSYPVHLVHELFFDSLAAVAEAMGSPEGERAGQVLQEISGGKVTLLFADHMQDELAHFRRGSAEAPPGDRA